MAERIVSLSQIDRRDQELVGPLVAKLGELSSLGIAVGEGFVVTCVAFKQFLQETSLESKIKKQIIEYPDSEEALSVLAKKSLQAAKLSNEFSRDLKNFFTKKPSRSSFLVRTLVGDSLMKEILLPERSTLEALEKALKSSWEAALEPKFLKNGKYLEAVVICSFFQGEETSGVVYSQKPIGAKKQIVVKALWGNISSIRIHPDAADTFIIDYASLEIVSRKLGLQPFQLVSTTKGLLEVSVPALFAHKQKLSDQQVLELAAAAKKAENHFLSPQEVAWRSSGEVLYIDLVNDLETTINLTIPHSNLTKFLKPLFSGSSLHNGIASGPVKLVSSLKKRFSVSSGNILVIQEFPKTYLPFLKRASGVVTETVVFAKNKHIFWDLGKPVLVATKKALESLKENQIVTLDASAGKLFAGSVNFKPVLLTPSPKIESSLRTSKTATKVMVSFSSAQLADEIYRKKADGVGLFRADLLIKESSSSKSDSVLTKTLEKLLEKFSDQPFFYRLSDGEEKDTVMESELAAIKKVRAKHRNLFVSVGNIKNPDELLSVKFALASHGLTPSSSFQFILCLENPTNLLMFEALFKVGISGICLDEEALTKSILGKSYPNEKDSLSLISSFEPVLKSAVKNGLFTNVYLQKASSDSLLLEKSIHSGVKAITVKANELEKARELVAQLENTLVVDRK